MHQITTDLKTRWWIKQAKAAIVVGCIMLNLKFWGGILMFQWRTLASTNTTIMSSSTTNLTKRNAPDQYQGIQCQDRPRDKHGIRYRIISILQTKIISGKVFTLTSNSHLNSTNINILSTIFPLASLPLAYNLHRSFQVILLLLLTNFLLHLWITWWCSTQIWTKMDDNNSITILKLRCTCSPKIHSLRHE